MLRALTGIVLLGAAGSAGAEIVTTHFATPADGRQGGRTWVDRVICVDGLKLFQTWPAGYPASTVQLYEEREGKVVPARCEVKDEEGG